MNQAHVQPTHHFGRPCYRGADPAGCGLVTAIIFLRPQGAFPPGFYPLSRGVGLIARAWGAPNKGNADGAKGIFGNSGRVWAMALCPVPPKKRPCAILSRKVGRATNTPGTCTTDILWGNMYLISLLDNYWCVLNAILTGCLIILNLYLTKLTHVWRQTNRRYFYH